ncbi:MAG: hypothetical protein ACI4ME_07220 [Aristaeellaceae bacterium]
MKIQISDNLIRHYLRNVYFINGHSYAGKSTMVRMLSERYGMIHCGENYHDAFPREKLDRWKQPGLCYFDTMSGWPEWLSQTPEEHYRWMSQTTQECIEIEILELLRLSAGGQKVIVDTNIPPEVLREISDYDHVAILLCDPPDITAQKFFDRDDPDKRFMLSEIRKCPDPEATLKNFNAWALYHPPLETDWQHTGFFTYTRSDFEHDTREEMLTALAKHFRL